MKIVFHVPEAARSVACLNNVRNYLQLADNEDVQVNVVFNGDAVKTLLSSEEIAQRWQALLAESAHVRLQVCHNSLNGFAIVPEQLIAAVEVVPVAVLALVQLQQQGWFYLRP